MTEKAFAGGMMLAYGVAIGNALARGTATTDELLALRSHASAVLDAQGDLVSALTALDEEIAKRAKGTKGLSDQITAEPGERFVVQLSGLTLPPGGKDELERAICETVQSALANIDTQGDVVATPLSEIKTFGGGFGGATAGMMVRRA